MAARIAAEKGANCPGFWDSSTVVAALAKITGRIRPESGLESADLAFAEDGTPKNAGVPCTPTVQLADHFTAMAAGELDWTHRPRLPFDRLILADAIQPHAVPAGAMNWPNIDQWPNPPALVASNHIVVAAIVPTISISANTRPVVPHKGELALSENPSGLSQIFPSEHDSPAVSGNASWLCIF